VSQNASLTSVRVGLIRSSNVYASPGNASALVLQSRVSGKGSGMRGVITKRDVIENLGLIWREFGPRCLIRCLGAVLTGRSTTFLELSLIRSSVGYPPHPRRKF